MISIGVKLRPQLNFYLLTAYTAEVHVYFILCKRIIHLVEFRTKISLFCCLFSCFHLKFSLHVLAVFPEVREVN